MKKINFSNDDNEPAYLSITNEGSIEIEYNIIENNSHVIKVTQSKRTITVKLKDMSTMLNFDESFYINKLEENTDLYIPIYGEISYINSKYKIIKSDNKSKMIFNYTVLDKEKKDFLEKLKSVNEIKNLDLRFTRVDSFSEDLIKVSFHGHVVNGSYVHDYQVAPNYIKQLELFLNCSVTWEGRESSHDIYHFNIYPLDIIEENSYKSNGKKLIFDSISAFETEGGEEWMFCYIFARYLTITDKINVLKEEELIDIGIELKDDIIYFDKKEIFKIVSIEKEEDIIYKGHNCASYRTHFNAQFDYFLDSEDYDDKNKNRELFLKKYSQIVNKTFQVEGYEIKCIDSRFYETSHYGMRIEITMEDGTKYSIGSSMSVFTKVSLDKYINQNNECNTNCFSTLIDIEFKNTKFSEIKLGEKDIFKLSKLCMEFNSSMSIEQKDRLERHGKKEELRNFIEYKIPMSLSENSFLFFEIVNDLNETTKYEIIKWMVCNDKIEWVQRLVNSGFSTPKSYINRKKLNNGYARRDFFKFCKNKKMKKLILNWIGEEFKDGFYLDLDDTYDVKTKNFYNIQYKENILKASIYRFTLMENCDDGEKENLFDIELLNETNVERNRNIYFMMPFEKLIDYTKDYEIDFKDLIVIKDIKESSKYLKKLEKFKILYDNEEEEIKKLRIDIFSEYYSFLSEKDIDFTTKDIQSFLKNKFNIRNSIFKKLLVTGNTELFHYYMDRAEGIDLNTYELSELLTENFDKLKLDENLIQLLKYKLKLDEKLFKEKEYDEKYR